MSVVENLNEERRITFCLYEYWEKLAGETDLPALKDMNRAEIEPFKKNLVLVDLRNGQEQPTFQVIGQDLQEDLDIDLSNMPVNSVPRRTMLSRITDHYLEVLANRVPIAFEAEFVNRDGEKALYRGILLPFSDNGKDINFILGGVRWILEKDVTLDDSKPTIEELMRSISEGRKGRPKVAEKDPVLEETANQDDVGDEVVLETDNIQDNDTQSVEQNEDLSSLEDTEIESIAAAEEDAASPEEETTHAKPTIEELLAADSPADDLTLEQEAPVFAEENTFELTDEKGEEEPLELSETLHSRESGVENVPFGETQEIDEELPADVEEAASFDDAEVSIDPSAEEEAFNTDDDPVLELTEDELVYIDDETNAVDKIDSETETVIEDESAPAKIVKGNVFDNIIKVPVEDAKTLNRKDYTPEPEAEQSVLDNEEAFSHDPSDDILSEQTSSEEGEEALQESPASIEPSEDDQTDSILETSDEEVSLVDQLENDTAPEPAFTDIVEQELAKDEPEFAAEEAEVEASAEHEPQDELEPDAPLDSIEASVPEEGLVEIDTELDVPNEEAELTSPSETEEKSLDINENIDEVDLVEPSQPLEEEIIVSEDETSSEDDYSSIDVPPSDTPSEDNDTAAVDVALNESGPLEETADLSEESDPLELAKDVTETEGETSSEEEFVGETNTPTEDIIEPSFEEDPIATEYSEEIETPQDEQEGTPELSTEIEQSAASVEEKETPVAEVSQQIASDKDDDDLSIEELMQSILSERKFDAAYQREQQAIEKLRDDEVAEEPTPREPDTETVEIDQEINVDEAHLSSEAVEEEHLPEAQDEETASTEASVEFDEATENEAELASQDELVHESNPDAAEDFFAENETSLSSEAGIESEEEVTLNKNDEEASIEETSSEDTHVELSDDQDEELVIILDDKTDTSEETDNVLLANEIEEEPQDIPPVFEDEKPPFHDEPITSDTEELEIDISNIEEDDHTDEDVQVQNIAENEVADDEAVDLEAIVDDALVGPEAEIVLDELDGERTDDIVAEDHPDLNTNDSSERTEAISEEENDADIGSPLDQDSFQDNPTVEPSENNIISNVASAEPVELPKPKRKGSVIERAMAMMTPGFGKKPAEIDNEIGTVNVEEESISETGKVEISEKIEPSVDTETLEADTLTPTDHEEPEIITKSDELETDLILSEDAEAETTEQEEADLDETDVIEDEPSSADDTMDISEDAILLDTEATSFEEDVLKELTSSDVPTEETKQPETIPVLEKEIDSAEADTVSDAETYEHSEDGLEETAEEDDDDHADIEGDELSLTELKSTLKQIVGYIKKEDANHNRSRDSLYNILTAIYEFHQTCGRSPDAYDEIVDEAGLKVQSRAPFTPVLKICLGKDYDKTRLTEYSAALGIARYMDVEVDEFHDFIKNFPGGIKGCVKEMRIIRKHGASGNVMARKTKSVEEARAILREMAPIASFRLKKVIVGNKVDEFCLLLAKRDGHDINVLKIIDDKYTKLDPIIKRTAFIKGNLNDRK